MHFALLVLLFLNAGFSSQALEKTVAANFTAVLHEAKSRFVDTTLLIKEFLGMKKMVLATAPKGYRKSTNADMLRRFCEARVAADGSLLPPETNENLGTFTGPYGDGKFLDIKQYEKKALFKKHFSRYPVIYLDYNRLDASSWENFLKGVKKMIRGVFVRHSYLLNSTNLSKKQKAVFNKYYLPQHILTIPSAYLSEGLPFMSTVLHAHFKRMPIVLVEDFDRPIMKVVGSYDIKDTLKLLMKFNFDLLRPKKHVRMALLSCRHQRGEVLSMVPFNVVHMPHSQSPFDMFYGPPTGEEDE